VFTGAVWLIALAELRSAGQPRLALSMVEGAAVPT
jgi:hypothetical protein